MLIFKQSESFITWTSKPTKTSKQENNEKLKQQK